MNTALALAQLRQGDTQQALALLDTLETHDTDWHAARGMALLAAGEPIAARAALAAGLARGDASAGTILNLALAEDGAGNSDRARALMRALTTRVPDWDEPWIRLAESLRRSGAHADAAAAYRQALDRDPVRTDALLGLAAIYIGAGNGGDAQTLLLRCLGGQPELVQAWDALGLALLQTGDIPAAEAAFAEAQLRAPQDYDIAARRAHAAHAGGRAEAELARLEHAAAADPLNPTLPTARAILLDQTGNRADALDALEAAVALAPQAAMPAILLAGMLTRSPRGPDAIIALRHALRLCPDNKHLANNLGAVLMRQHQHAEAAQILRGVRAQHGDDPTCLCNLANVTVLLGEQEAAVTIARAALRAAPDAALSYRALANVLPYNSATDPPELLAALRGLSDRLAREKPNFNNRRNPGRRIRIGLLSGSLRTHPVGWLTVAGFENLDPAAFEIHCLAQTTSHDPIARRFRAIAAGWHAIDHLDDAALAVFVRSLEIDFIIDLGGYGDAGRMAACARRLAPVQAKWVGMQNHSTGLAEMDWFITDRWETPVELSALYSERLLRLPDGYVCYSPPAHAPDVATLPALRNGHITFGCFNNLAKITPQVIATWCEILRALPDARLVMKTHQFSEPATCQRILAIFIAQGVHADRLELRGASGHREFLRQYGDIDIVLDPFPYTGGLTTCEALWMGVPTVTLVGEIFAARHSFSHLSNVGLHDWVSWDRASYIGLAVAKAQDIPKLAELRTRLRTQTKDSPLCNGPLLGQNLGAALRHAWSDWCMRP